jgi:hypothetical protein
MIDATSLRARLGARLRPVPSASPWLRAMVGAAAAASAIALVARVTSLGIDRGRALAFVGGFGVVFVLLAATAVPRAATLASTVLLLLPLAALGAKRAEAVAVELAVLAVLSVELTAWAADLRSRVREDAASVRRRVVEVAAAIAATAAIASLALAVADIEGPQGRAALVAGLAAIATVAGLLTWRARAVRTPRR